MKVAILHYHLKTGGVTTVIERQVEALQGLCDFVVLSGDRDKTRLSCPMVDIPELDYPKLSTLNGCVEYLISKLSL